MTTKKCCKCKRQLPSENFFYKNKDHSTCQSCAEKRRVGKRNVCTVCGIGAIFNLPEQKNGIRCKKHADPNMIDVVSKKCIICHIKQPSYNHPGQTTGLYCKDCKEPDMVDVVSKKCIICHIKRPKYNHPGKKAGLYCKDCKEPDMVDVANRKCIICHIKQPIYNHPDQKVALYCKEHALAGMINIKHKRCENCSTLASYGFPCNQPSRCSQHKEDGMIYRSNRKCMKQTCNDYAMFGRKQPIHCETHKDDNDICLVERKCSKCCRIDVVNDEGLCLSFCNMDKGFAQYKKYSKEKQQRVINILTAECGQPDQLDKRITDDPACSNHRPDVVYDCKTHWIIIEVDENQHRHGSDNYTPQCEIARTKNIYQDGGGIPIIFIRYNPDNYKDRSGKTVKLPPGKKEEVLIKWVKHFQKTEPTYNLSTIFLFYDNYDKADTPILEIDPYELNDKYECVDCGSVMPCQSMLDHHKTVCATTDIIGYV